MIAGGVADVIPEPFNAAAVAIATGLQVVVDTLNLTAAILQKSIDEIAACEEAAFQQVAHAFEIGGVDLALGKVRPNRGGTVVDHIDITNGVFVS